MGFLQRKPMILKPSFQILQNPHLGSIGMSISLLNIKIRSGGSYDPCNNSKAVTCVRGILDSATVVM